MAADIEDIYQKHRREMLAMAAAITNCPSRAQDAVQTAFCQLCASGRQADTHPVAYAFAAVRNAAVDQKPALEMGSETLANLAADSTPDPLAELIAGEDRRLARQLLRSLPTRQREVVVLHLYSGWTFRRIAEALDEPLGTVATRYRRAMNRLRDAFPNGEGPNPRLPR